MLTMPLDRNKIIVMPILSWIIASINFPLQGVDFFLSLDVIFHLKGQCAYCTVFKMT